MRTRCSDDLPPADIRLHRHPRADLSEVDDCELFMQSFDHNAKSGERKVAATVTKMRDMAEAGLLTPDGIGKIAANAGLQPRRDVTKAIRIAARVNQQRLTA